MFSELLVGDSQHSFNMSSRPRTDLPYNNSKGDSPVDSRATSRYANNRYGKDVSQFLGLWLVHRLNILFRVPLNRSTIPSI